MRYWLRGKRGGLIAFLCITALVAGGLGWMTAAVLRLEREQLEGQARAEQDDQLRLAMWKLEARVAPALAIEDNRPYNDYSPIYATSKALVCQSGAWKPDTILEPSPLLGAELPDWILLHFQTDQSGNWSSPEVLSPGLSRRIRQSGIEASCDNATPHRVVLLDQLKASLQPSELLAEVRRRGEQALRADSTLELTNLNPNPAWDNSSNTGQAAQPAPQSQTKDEKGGYQSRAAQQSKLFNDAVKNTGQQENRTVVGGNFFTSPETWFGRGQIGPLVGDSVPVSRGPLVRTWLTNPDREDWLIAARLVHVGEREVCQGILLDWSRLQKVLGDEVADLLPNARFEPIHEMPPAHPERAMINLPIDVVPGMGPLALADPGWTPLRVGLALAWAAALVALLAVGLGSWSLLDLSERR
ncbi:MAG TPA: hypothetical protein VKE94_11110, partial [Gemmataceae bacterium]|nr:hypothetical protein [Gemmataceae bacterium]